MNGGYLEEEDMPAIPVDRVQPQSDIKEAILDNLCHEIADSIVIGEDCYSDIVEWESANLTVEPCNRVRVRI